MELTTDPYGFSATHAEGLFLRLAREMLIIQDDATLNPDSLEIVTVETDETAKLTSVAIADVLGNFTSDMAIEVLNPFQDSLVTTGTAAPWNKTNHLAALVDIGIWLCNQERNLAINTNNKFVFDYSFSSQGDVVQPHFGITLNANDIPLTVTLAGQAAASEAAEWLTGVTT